MEVFVLNTNFETLGIIDVYESFIWTDRYNSYGDFEIYTPITDKMMELLKQDNYIWFKESDHMMIVEEIQISSDIEDGDKLIVTGRSLESILDRRILWKKVTLTNNTFYQVCMILLSWNVMSPSDTSRQIPGFYMKTDDGSLDDIRLDVQYDRGENLYEVIETLCQTFDIGFKITLDEDNKFCFSLYRGEDRSYNQTVNPYVVFSPNFENIINSNYIESKKAFKNTGLVVGEEVEGQTQKEFTRSLNDVTTSGLDRREIYVDCSSVSKTREDETVMTDSEYTNILKQKADEEFAQNIVTKSFEGQVETTRSFKYNEDFFMGDIVQIVNEHNIESHSRITEMIYSQDNSGVSVYPTFQTVE